MADRRRRRPLRIAVIIPAAGTGSRMGGRLPKQFLPLARRPILARTLDAFDRHPLVSEIVVASAPEHMRRVTLLMMRLRLRTPWSVVAGGANRQESVWCGLHAFDLPPDLVLVHDAVRPLVGEQVITNAIAACRRTGAAVVCVRVKDTVKLERPRGYAAKTLDRSALWAAQTPQAFAYPLLLQAHRRARKRGFLGTDEASLVERCGIPVRIVEGDYANVKITTPADLAMARALLGRR